MALAEDLLQSLLEKSNKQDQIFEIVKEKMADLDKNISVLNIEVKAELKRIEAKLYEHSKFCPINKVEIKNIVSDEVSKQLHGQKKEKKDDSNEYTKVFKSIPFIERLIIYGFLAYFIASKLGWV